MMMTMMTTTMMMTMMMKKVLTALQLQGAHLAVHGVLGEVHVAGDRGRDAVTQSQQDHEKQRVHDY